MSNIQSSRSRSSRSQAGSFDSRTIFFLGLLLAASGIVSPPVALAGGIAFGFTIEHPFRQESHTLAKLLLQISVVALGFGMNLHQVLHAGRSGFLYTAISITSAIALGLLFGRLLHIGGKASYLITIGTAICGGSAIAAIAPITDANEEEISISMGTVFVLNSVALLLFPAIGAAMHLDQNQFGLWAALAIHDTSSVVGAAAKYGEQALAVGTAVKMARALWIVPLALITATFMRASARRQTASPDLTTEATDATDVTAVTDATVVTSVTASPRVAIPWFIFLFCLATVASTYAPRFSAAYAALSHLGRSGLTATLFLIGTSLSIDTLRKVGIRPFVQGISLWIIVASVSLAAIYYRWIAI